ncbi:hypothetical protein ER308_07095 [Egibacter rhizosphaerae]|uniref:Uncharacterized protein n=1 Tax=Egibacter rhizosphaerae TaxID=1670831 RepID=A0A411YDW1_9ACTN|nr:hypothetical protein [Egibacter rhizosphaerae]QBI19332.1 hypothetical protein ER308_07095 [Egibacter rhizosphaerae]
MDTVTTLTEARVRVDQLADDLHRAADAVEVSEAGTLARIRAHNMRTTADKIAAAAGSSSPLGPVEASARLMHESEVLAANGREREAVACERAAARIAFE